VKGDFMAGAAEKIRAILDNKIVSFVSIMDLDEALKGGSKAKQFSTLGPIGFVINDDEIILTMEHEVPKKEALVIPLADDMIVETAPCGKSLGVSDDDTIRSLKVLSNSLRVVAVLQYVDKEENTKAVREI
jgi:hypothetical protein